MLDIWRSGVTQLQLGIVAKSLAVLKYDHVTGWTCSMHKDDKFIQNMSEISKNESFWGYMSVG
jgi:hypothetical protein